MQCKIGCPGCGIDLAVPMDAGGRMARCKTCQLRFRVPDLSSQLEDSVADFLYEEPSDEEELDDQTTDQNDSVMEQPSQEMNEHSVTHDVATAPSAQESLFEKPQDIRVYRAVVVPEDGDTTAPLKVCGLHTMGVRIHFKGSRMHDIDEILSISVDGMIRRL